MSKKQKVDVTKVRAQIAGILLIMALCIALGAMFGSRESNPPSATSMHTRSLAGKSEQCQKYIDLLTDKININAKIGIFNAYTFADERDYEDGTTVHLSSYEAKECLLPVLTQKGYKVDETYFNGEHWALIIAW